ncbi:MAG: ADP-forming succinate--CoA ligase subunit beta [Candidatus Bathyarchaeota archaeon]|nr:ADP-forming succinate--CoA ligase subunit beta [Candidatus Bathyarchaeota archaeon]MDH5745374.1 ADP-forming succinate--CoA ligase subunit beta [Candidatus Bathyarchaeota archaeon]
MRLFEYEAKEIFKKFGIPVPKGLVVRSAKEAASAAKQIRLPVAVKAQILVGGRGNAGGIKFTSDLDEVIAETKKLINRRIKGRKVKMVLIEEKLDIQNEYYMGVTIDQLSGKPILMFSTEGGVDVETIAKKKPEMLISKKISVSRGFFQFEARDMCMQLGLKGSTLLKVGSILHKLYEVFIGYDAMIAEINPLIITSNGEPYAVDAKLEVDDNALFRQPNLELNLSTRYEDKIKIEAIKHGLSYVRLDGDIGVIGSGAGLTMATIDLITDFGGKPANFLETGGGITEELMTKAVELVLKDRRLKGLLINLYGGINPMPSAAKGIVKAYEKLKPKIPVLVKLVGNQQEEAWNILGNYAIPIAKKIQTEKAVEKLMNLLGG